MAKNSPIDEVKRAQGMDARRGVLEEIFNDYYDDRRNIYKVNFVRGIFFGLGTVIGATVVVAMVLWILSFFVDIPIIGDAAQQAKDSLNRGK